MDIEAMRKALRITREELEAALREITREELTSGDPTISTPMGLGAKPETEYNSTATADDAFIQLAPPSGQYVYLMCITANVGTDGDSVELQVLCTDDIWRTVDKLKMLANTSMVKGYPNLKLDKIRVAGVEYAVKAGDGTTATVRLVSRGTGGWEASVQYYFGE